VAMYSARLHGRVDLIGGRAAENVFEIELPPAGKPMFVRSFQPLKQTVDEIAVQHRWRADRH
jgi:hypothetical protein